MQKQGYRKSTTHYCIRALKSVARNSNLLDPESTKTYLATANLTESRKAKLAEDLARYYNYKHIPFNKPYYKRIEKLPFVPLTSEVDQLIAGVGKKTATYLQLLKETGIRAGEAWNLQWTDLNPENSTVNITPEKNSNPRQLKISNRLLSMLNTLPKHYNYIFRNPQTDSLASAETFRKLLAKQRKRIANKLQNPRIIQITFKSLRHYKATMEYHRTKDILHVMRILGHKNIKNTLVYTHLVNFESDDYICKTANTVKEAAALIENGFEYVTDFQDTKLFRKRK